MDSILYFMNNYYLNEFKSEKFELALNVEESRISSNELRSYLLQLEKLVDSINETLNNYNGWGYDVISIDVVALERGSFKIPLIFKKFFNSENYEKIIKMTENPTAAIIIGTIIVNLFTGGMAPRNVEEIHEYPIDKELFYRNIKTVKAVKKIAELALYNDSIHDISITYEGKEGEQKISISKGLLSDTKFHMDDIIFNDERPHFLDKVYLKVISPALGDDADVLWKFRFEGKIIEAEMHDNSFQELFNDGEITFKKGDEILVDMMVEGRGKHRNYYIIYVYNSNYIQ